MGTLFENIVNNLILEISSEDAYNRYYKSLDKSVYDALMDGVNDMTAFHRLALNCLVTNKNYDIGAVNAINSIWKSLDTNRKRELINKSKQAKNSIKTVEDVVRLINDVSSSDEFKSKNDVSSDGYHVLYQTDKVKVTCTTTYMANHHYFGRTKWCTASDLGGDYNGHQMFLWYVRHGGTQFGSKNAVNYALLQFEYSDGTLIQGAFKSDGQQGEICNMEDKRVKLNEIFKGGIFSANEFEDRIVPQLQSMIEETERMMPIEREYIIRIVNKKRPNILNKLPKVPTDEEFAQTYINKLNNGNYDYEYWDGNVYMTLIWFNNKKCIEVHFCFVLGNLLNEDDAKFLNNTDIYFEQSYGSMISKVYIVNLQKNKVYSDDSLFDIYQIYGTCGQLVFGVPSKNDSCKFFVFNSETGKCDKYKNIYVCQRRKYRKLQNIFVFANRRKNYIVYNANNGEFLFECDDIEFDNDLRCVKFWKNNPTRNIICQKSFEDLGVR